jgi:hypothetical protein
VDSSFPASPPAATAELTLLDSEPGVVTVYAHGNITIIVWWGRASPQAAQRLHRVTEQRRKQHPEGLSAIHIVKGDVVLPDQATRDALVRVMKDSDTSLAALAVVIGGGGFWASALRSVITGMRVLSRSAFELRLHGTIDEALAWLPDKHAQRTGVAVDKDRLRHSLETAGSAACPDERAAS